MGTENVSTEGAAHTAADAVVGTTVAGIDLGDPQLAATVREGLKQVEELLVSELSEVELGSRDFEGDS